MDRRRSSVSPNSLTFEVISLDELTQKLKTDSYVVEIFALLDMMFLTHIVHERKRLAETVAMILLGI